MTDTNQLPPLPHLQPGDSHMESLIEAAIQGHASTREAMRWLVRQLVPQPAQATQAEVTDEQINAAYLAWCKTSGTPESFARAILALRPQQSGLTGCNCRWDGDTQVQWCELHLAHKEAIHEWAERAKEAEKQLALRPAAVPMTDEHLSVLKEMADRCPELNLSNYDSDDVDELNSWAVEIAVYIDGITTQAKKEGV